MIVQCGLLPDVHSHIILLFTGYVLLVLWKNRHGKVWFGAWSGDLKVITSLQKGFTLSLIITRMLQRDKHPDIVTCKVLVSGRCWIDNTDERFRLIQLLEIRHSMLLCSLCLSHRQYPSLHALLPLINCIVCLVADRKSI